MDIETALLAIGFGASHGCFLTVAWYRRQRDRAQALTQERARELELETRLVELRLTAALRGA